MAQRITGVDITREKIRTATIVVTYKEFFSAGFFEEPIPSGEAPLGDRIALALKALKEKGAFETDQVVVNLMPEDVSFHKLKFPFADKRRIEQTLPFELEEKLPFEFEKAIYDYTVISREKDSISLLVAVTQQEKITLLLNAFNSVQIDPPVLTADVFAYPALLSFFQQSSQEPRETKVKGKASEIVHPTVLLIDIGEVVTSISIVEGDLVRSCRSIRWGTTRLQAQGNNTTQLNTLLNQIKLSLQADAAQGTKLPEKIYLMGEACGYEGFDEFFKSGLGIETSLLPSFAARKFGSEEEIVSPPSHSFARSIALALFGKSGRRNAVNFRKGAFAFKGDVQNLRGAVIRIASGALLIVIFLLVNSYVKYSGLSNYEEELDAKLCEVTKTVLGKCYDNYTQALSAMQAPLAKNTGIGAIPAYTALDILTQISIHTPKDAALFEVSDIDVSLNKIHIEGRIDTYNSLDSFVNEMKQYECFKDVNIVRSAKALDGKSIDFQINIKVECGETGKS